VPTTKRKNRLCGDGSGGLVGETLQLGDERQVRLGDERQVRLGDESLPVRLVRSGLVFFLSFFF
jgi:hypothetical protein